MRAPSGRDVLILLGLQAAGVLLYFSTLRHGPVWDDWTFVVQEGTLRRCSSLGSVLSASQPNSARPAWRASLIADACLAALPAPGSAASLERWFLFARAGSLLWHGLGALLLLVLAWDLSGDRRVAVAAAALFLANPLHAEVVDVLTYRADLLAFAFGAAALCFHRRGRLVRAAFCFALALLSKESAACVPLLAGLVDALFPGVRSQRARFYAVYAAVLAVYLVFRAPRAGYSFGGHVDLLSAVRDRLVPGLSAATRPAVPWQKMWESPGARFLTMSGVFGRYLRVLAWPSPLQGDYAPRLVESFLDRRAWAAWAGWSAAVYAAVRLRRASPVGALGILWCAAALAPVSGLVALRNPQADRYLYFSSAGVALAWAGLAAWAARRARAPALKRAPWLALGGLATAFAAMTVVRNADFRDNLSFFRSILTQDDGVARAHYGLALEYERLGRGEEARREHQAAVALWPELGALQNPGMAPSLRQRR